MSFGGSYWWHIVSLVHAALLLSVVQSSCFYPRALLYVGPYVLKSCTRLLPGSLEWLMLQCWLVFQTLQSQTNSFMKYREFHTKNDITFKKNRSTWTYMPRQILFGADPQWFPLQHLYSVSISRDERKTWRFELQVRVFLKASLFTHQPCCSELWWDPFSRALIMLNLSSQHQMTPG